MVFERTRPSRPAECTLRRIRATSGCGASSSSTAPACLVFRSSLSSNCNSNSSMGSSSVDRLGHGSIKVAPGGRRSARGRLVGLCRNSSFQAADQAHQISGGALGLGDLALELAASVGLDGGCLGLALEPGDEIAQVVLHRLDLVLEADE